jgi:hypothetical protein
MMKHRPDAIVLLLAGRLPSMSGLHRQQWQLLQF